MIDKALSGCVPFMYCSFSQSQTLETGIAQEFKRVEVVCSQNVTSESGIRVVYTEGRGYFLKVPHRVFDALSKLGQ